MTANEKLDIIIELLTKLITAQSSEQTPKPRYVSAHIADVVKRWFIAAEPGYYTMKTIADACQLPDDKRTMIAIGRAMDELGATRWRRKDGRGFRF